MILTYRYRVKNLSGFLNEQARAVNIVWNWCNDCQKHARKWAKQWPTAFDLINLASGACQEIPLGSASIGAVCRQYVRSRRTKNRPYLRYRGRKSLGWIPIRAEAIKPVNGGFRFSKHVFRVFDSRPLPEGATIKDGSSFSQDAKGNWYLNVVFEINDPEPRKQKTEVGIDLGLKDFAVLSTGEKVTNPREFRRLEERLGKAQRARKKRQVTNIHQKIKNRRRDMLHKLSTRIAREFDYIAVGNVNAAGLAKTKLAKSITDAGWSSFRSMLAYKSIREGAIYEEVDERFSTQTCSACGCISGPEGRAGLNERSWVCSECGCEHDRDLNASVNLLLRSGHRAPVQGAAV